MGLARARHGKGIGVGSFRAGSEEPCWTAPHGTGDVIVCCACDSAAGGLRAWEKASGVTAAETHLSELAHAHLESGFHVQVLDTAIDSWLCGKD